MAITRTDINGDFAALKAALETLVPDFFATVIFDDDTTPTTIHCKDADDNTIFEIEKNTSANAWQCRVYKGSEEYQEQLMTQSSGGAAMFQYMYKVGNSGAFLTYKGGDTYGPVIIAKTNTGKTGFAMPQALSSSAYTKVTTYIVGCWGDDTSQNSTLVIANTQNMTAPNTPMTGNHTLFVPIPLHGSYSEQLYMQKAYFLPIAQTGQRGVIQELADSTSGERYLSNGYVAMLDG